MNRRKEITKEMRARYKGYIVGRIRVSELEPGVWEAVFNLKNPRSHCCIVMDYRSA